MKTQVNVKVHKSFQRNIQHSTDFPPGGVLNDHKMASIQRMHSEKNLFERRHH